MEQDSRDEMIARLKRFIVRQGEAHARQYGMSEEEVKQFGREYLELALTEDETVLTEKRSINLIHNID